MEILAWDLECSGLNADYGMILCIGFKPVKGGKAEVWDVASYGNNYLTSEKRLLKDASDRLLKSDIWLTWFGTYYDIPFINSRLLYHRLPVLPAGHPHIDGWRTAKNRLKLRNNRLATVQDFLGLEHEKDAVKGPEWIKAMQGDRKALKYIIEHCRKDVLVLEEAYNLLRPLIVDHPFKDAGKNGACPVCEEQALQKRGYHLTKTRKYQRYQCQNCGSWTKATQPVSRLYLP